MSKSTQPTAPPPQPPFEEALKRLEAIVEEMESDDLPLEALLARYEEATGLTRQCQARLSEAELKLQQLERNDDGNLQTRPLALDETAEP